jgi:hypothetical protein
MRAGSFTWLAKNIKIVSVVPYIELNYIKGRHIVRIKFP